MVAQFDAFNSPIPYFRQPLVVAVMASQCKVALTENKHFLEGKKKS